jgi:hypothetical protein
MDTVEASLGSLQNPLDKVLPEMTVVVPDIPILGSQELTKSMKCCCMKVIGRSFFATTIVAAIVLSAEAICVPQTCATTSSYHRQSLSILSYFFIVENGSKAGETDCEHSTQQGLETLERS